MLSCSKYYYYHHPRGEQTQNTYAAQEVAELVFGLPLPCPKAVLLTYAYCLEAISPAEWLPK